MPMIPLGRNHPKLSRTLAGLYLLIWSAGMVWLILTWNDLTWGWRIGVSTILGLTAPAIEDVKDILLTKARE